MIKSNFWGFLTEVTFFVIGVKLFPGFFVKKRVPIKYKVATKLIRAAFQESVITKFGNKSEKALQRSGI